MNRPATRAEATSWPASAEISSPPAAQQTAADVIGRSAPSPAQRKEYLICLRAAFATVNSSVFTPSIARIARPITQIHIDEGPKKMRPGTISKTEKPENAQN